MDTAITQPASLAPLAPTCDYALIGMLALSQNQCAHAHMCGEILKAGRDHAIATIALAESNPLAVCPHTLSAIREIFGLTVDLETCLRNLAHG